MYTYYHPITVRYRDLDPQRHVNNTVYLTYLESARLGYYEAVGIWRHDSGLATGMVVVHNDIDYITPIVLGDDVQVGIQLVKLGTKSLAFEFQIESKKDGRIFAKGKSVMVAYDNQADKSIPIPEDWREKINRYEKGN
jgi:acyl-CoA thioester hydrolase